MLSSHLLRLELHEPESERVVVFGVVGGRRAGPTLLVHSPTLLVHLGQLDDDVERVVFVEGSSPDSIAIASIHSMIRAIGPEDGLVQFQVAAEAIKQTKGPQVDGIRPLPVVIERGVDRPNVVSFRPPELLRISALLAALAMTPSQEWVNPAGLIVANGGWIDTYPSQA